jgi:hypothetical protein
LSGCDSLTSVDDLKALKNLRILDLSGCKQLPPHAIEELQHELALTQIAYPRHYHVRLQSAHGPILSTQLYFPGEARNADDFLFRRDLLLKIQGTTQGWAATFNFVLETS